MWLRNFIVLKANRILSLWCSERGTATAEFGIFVPLFVFGALTMGDIGIAVQQRMALDHVVRAGAQIAMTDPGEDQLMSTLESAAGENFAVQSDAQTAPYPVTLEAVRYCSCPEDRGVATSCSDACPGSVPPFAFYRVSAAKTYHGILIPDLRMSSVMNVQLR